MKHFWIAALGGMLLLEGIIPFLWPRRWRKAISRIGALADGQIRFLGLFALVAGAVLLAAAEFLS